jgi:hypothetical protein
MVGPVEVSEETNYPEFEIKKLHREYMQLKSTSQSICWLTTAIFTETKIRFSSFLDMGNRLFFLHFYHMHCTSIDWYDNMNGIRQGCYMALWPRLYWLYHSEWVIVVLRQFSKLSAISWREQVNFQWDDDEIRFVVIVSVLASSAVDRGF